MIGLIFLAFAPWFWVASPDALGKTSAVVSALIGVLWLTLAILDSRGF